MIKESAEGQTQHAAYSRLGRLPLVKVLALFTLLLPLLLPSTVRGDFDSSAKNSQEQPKQTKDNDRQAKSSKPSPGSQKKGAKSSAQPKKSKNPGARKKPEKTA